MALRSSLKSHSKAKVQNPTAGDMSQSICVGRTKGTQKKLISEFLSETYLHNFADIPCPLYVLHVVGHI
jgi:hypothetical protein